MNGGTIEPLRGYRAAALALFASAIPMILVAIAARAPQVCFGLLHAFLFGWMSWAFAHRSLRGGVTTGELAVTGDAITLDGRALVRRADLTQGSIVPDRDRTIVHLERRGRFAPPLYLVVPDESSGQEVLRELGFDPASSAIEMRMGSGLASLHTGAQFAWLLGPLALTMALSAVVGTFAGPLAIPIALAGIAVVIGVAFTPMKVRVGTDGIVTRWLGRRRFVPFSEIESAEPRVERHGRKRFFGVYVTLRSGEVLKLPAGRSEVGESDAMRLAKRIADARVARESGVAAKAALERGTRDSREWLHALRGVGNAGALRTPAIPREVLLRVLEDGAMDETTRVGAAVAVLADEDDATLARVRRAANVTASPNLRVALERIATPLEDDELTAILDEVGREQAS